MRLKSPKMEQASHKESPTHYMLPEQVNEETCGSVLVDYTLNGQAPAKYPITTKKMKKSQKKKKKKPKQGKTVQFHSKVITKTFYKKLNSTLEEIDLANEEEYPVRNSDFAIKQREQKLMKLHHQHGPLIPRHVTIVKHI